MRSRQLRVAFGLALVTLACACTAPHKLISARHISCPPRKLQIREFKSGPEREDWIAVCGDKHYACATREQGRRLLYGCRPLPNARDASVPGATDAGVR